MSYQPLAEDCIIDGLSQSQADSLYAPYLSGTGFLKKTAENTWVLDTNSYGGLDSENTWSSLQKFSSIGVNYATSPTAPSAPSTIGTHTFSYGVGVYQGINTTAQDYLTGGTIAHQIRVKAFKIDSNGKKIFSLTYKESSVYMPTTGKDGVPYQINWGWSSVSGANGYRVYIKVYNDDFHPYDFDAYFDVYGTTYFSDRMEYQSLQVDPAIPLQTIPEALPLHTINGNFSVNGDIFSKSLETDYLRINKHLTLPGGLTAMAFETGWINFANGAGGIGNGGVGNNAWIAGAASNGQWFLNASKGDVVYRNTTGKLLFGTTADDYASFQISNNRVLVGQNITDDGVTQFQVKGNSLFNGTIKFIGTKNTILQGSASGTDKTITFPNVTGTVALTSDLTKESITGLKLTDSPQFAAIKLTGAVAGAKLTLTANVGEDKSLYFNDWNSSVYNPNQPIPSLVVQQDWYERQNFRGGIGVYSDIDLSTYKLKTGAAYITGNGYNLVIYDDDIGVEVTAERMYNTISGKSLGTSGNTVPLLDGNNTWSGNQTHTGRMVVRTTASDPQHATPSSRPAGSVAEIAYYSGKMYFCTNSTTPTWEKITSS